MYKEEATEDAVRENATGAYADERARNARRKLRMLSGVVESMSPDDVRSMMLGKTSIGGSGKYHWGKKGSEARFQGTVMLGSSEHQTRVKVASAPDPALVHPRQSTRNTWKREGSVAPVSNREIALEDEEVDKRVKNLAKADE
jgi:hypothetical protein